MLSSILLAGSELDRIMTVSKEVYVSYFDQVRSSVKLVKKTEEMHHSATWKHNTGLVLFLENFGLDVFGERMLWNPLWCGTMFCTITNIGNLYSGCGIIDYQAQLRISLYLYHGLILNGISIKEKLLCSTSFMILSKIVKQYGQDLSLVEESWSKNSGLALE